jgi:signal peptidase I
MRKWIVAVAVVLLVAVGIRTYLVRNHLTMTAQVGWGEPK